MRFWAGAIAHEVRTPLLSIAMMSESLNTFLSNLESEAPDLSQASPRFLRSMEYIKRLPSLFAEVTKNLNHFVDMSLMKVQPDRPKTYDLKPLKIQESIESVLQAYPFKAHGEGSERELVHVSIENDFTFDGEETLFKHLIYNLMKNALYFIKDARKGEIFITASSEKGENILRFKDTGPGIPPKNIEHLFKAFYTKSRGGTGVGLSLCRAIMQEFGGSIECRSTLGEFTEFVMRFPR